MDNHQFREMADDAYAKLSARGIIFDPGLNDEEISAAESTYGFIFPPDLRLFLKLHLPISDRFPDWRRRPNTIWEQIRWPAKGIIFDVAKSGYWRREWGSRPSSLEEAIHIAEEKIASVPKLIPVWGHSYLPATPHRFGNPIFSVYQTDVIHRGEHLFKYLDWIFHPDSDSVEDDYPAFSEKYTHIIFWTELARENYFS